MPISERLPPAVLRGIAIQIGQRLPRLLNGAIAAPGSHPGVGESLKIMMLRLDRLRDGDGPLAPRLTDTGQSHHQIYTGGTAANFARSAAPAAPGGDRRVIEVATSPLAAALKTTIAWTDANIPENAEARLLTVPDYQLTALWLYGDGADAVVIAAMPASLEGLALNTRIESDDFMRRLAANPPIAGLGPPAGAAAPPQNLAR